MSENGIERPEMVEGGDGMSAPKIEERWALVGRLTPPPSEAIHQGYARSSFEREIAARRLEQGVLF